MNKAPQKEHLFLELDKAIKYGRIFVITSIISMIAYLLFIVLAIILAGVLIYQIQSSNFSSIPNIAGSVFGSLLLIIVIVSITIVSLIYNILAAIKYGNVFDLINPASSILKGEDDIKNNPEILLTIKNTRNCLWINLIIVILGGTLLLFGMALFGSLVTIVTHIVMIVLVWKSNKKLIEWKETGRIGRIENKL